MISVAGVRPTPREMRPIRKGWGAMHAFMLGPILVPFVGLWALACWGVGPYADRAVLLAALIGTPVAWVVSRLLADRAVARATRLSPASDRAIDWRLDETGIELSNDLFFSRIRWGALVSVREEENRFVFLLTPPGSPILPKRVLTPDQQTELRMLLADLRASGRLGRGVD